MGTDANAPSHPGLVRHTPSRRSRTRRRERYGRIAVLPLTVLRTLAMLRKYDLGAFVPFVVLLLMGAGMLWIVNAIAPLAPLIYSLF